MVKCYETAMKGIEQYVKSLYPTNHPSNVTAPSHLRWCIFSEHQYFVELLPPTPEALKYKIFRCHFMCMVWKRSRAEARSYLPSLTDIGWIEHGEEMKGETADLITAPEMARQVIKQDDVYEEGQTIVYRNVF